MDTQRQIRRAAGHGIRVTVVALLTSVVLAAIKIVAGLLGSSYALVADGIESLLDIFGALVVIGGLRLSVAPQSERFPYGFGKVEALAGLLVAAVLVLAAVGIAVQAVREIITPHAAPAPFTLVVLVLVIGVKEVLFRTLFRRAELIGSQALATDAWHHRSDAITSAAAFVGISLALVLGEGYESADDWAALVACGVIGYNGVRLFRGALLDILDVAAPPEIDAAMRSLAAAVPGVTGLDVVRVRRSGLAYFVDIHVEVDGALPVRDGHEVAHAVKRALVGSEWPVLDVLVHVEPAPEDRSS